MEIIKHGKTYEVPQEKVCPDCECVFTYVEKDIKQYWGRNNTYGCYLIYTYISCPDCGATIIIKDYRKQHYIIESVNLFTGEIKLKNNN